MWVVVVHKVESFARIKVVLNVEFCTEHKNNEKVNRFTRQKSSELNSITSYTNS